MSPTKTMIPCARGEQSNPGRRWKWAFILTLSVLGWHFGCASAPETNPEQAHFHYQLGVNYFNENLIPQAQRELLLALEDDPKNADALHLLGFIHMGRRDYSKASQHFRSAINIRLDFYICINNPGTALLALERWDEAVEIYSGLLEKPMYNTPELAYNNLGWAYYNLGKQERAEESLQMAVFLKPTLCLAHNNLGLVYTKAKNNIGAIRSFEAAITKCPNFVEPHFHIAQLLRERNDPKALKYYQRCYELGSNSTMGDRCRSYLEVY